MSHNLVVMVTVAHFVFDSFSFLLHKKPWNDEFQKEPALVAGSIIKKVDDFTNLATAQEHNILYVEMKKMKSY